MVRIAMTVKIRPDLVEEYKEYHRNVWPEIEEVVRRAGFRNLSIFLSGNTLFMYQEYHGAQPIEQAYGEYATNEKCQEWERLMGKFQEGPLDSASGTRWVRMEEVYHLEG